MFKKKMLIQFLTCLFFLRNIFSKSKNKVIEDTEDSCHIDFIFHIYIWTTGIDCENIVELQ